MFDWFSVHDKGMKCFMYKYNEMYVDCHIRYSWDGPELQTCATFLLFDLYFETCFRPRLILLLMDLCLMLYTEELRKQQSLDGQSFR